MVFPAMTESRMALGCKFAFRNSAKKAELMFCGLTAQRMKSAFSMASGMLSAVLTPSSLLTLSIMLVETS